MDPYSSEFRGEVLAACDANEGTRDIAVRFQVSESWVRRIMQQRRETGQVAAKTASPRQAPRLRRTRRRQARPARAAPPRSSSDARVGIPSDRFRPPRH